jgi:hypothetical protein
MAKRKPYRVYRIVNAEGGRVCERRTKKECVALLDKYVTDPPTNKYWDTGPYFIWRIDTLAVMKHRPRMAKATAPKGERT